MDDWTHNPQWLLGSTGIYWVVVQIPNSSTKEGRRIAAETLAALRRGELHDACVRVHPVEGCVTWLWLELESQKKAMGCSAGLSR